MFDPATLAAVREAIAGYRGAVSRHLTPTEAYNLGKVDAMKAAAALGPVKLKEIDMATDQDMDTRAAPALTADDVRRIAREEAEAAINRQRQAELDPFYDPRTGKRAGDAPPAPPAAAKRVEAFLNVYEGNAVPDHWRVWPTRDQAESGRSATRHHVRVAYVREWPGVHDAASADAFDRAVLGAYRALIYGGQGSRDEAVAALAPCLPVSR